MANLQQLKQASVVHVILEAQSSALVYDQLSFQMTTLFGGGGWKVKSCEIAPLSAGNWRFYIDCEGG